MSSVHQHNRDHYTRETAVAEYSESGLFPLEAALIDEFFPPAPARVLDLGCGTGRTTVGLDARGFETCAIDLSEAMVARARVLHPGLDFRTMDAAELDFPDASFDAALFSFNGIDLIFPVERRLACLREVFRILRPGGSFLFSTHNLAGELFRGSLGSFTTYRRALRLLSAQVRNPVVFSGYLRLAEGESHLWIHARLPSATVRQLAEVGFSDPEIRGFSGEKRVGRIAREHVHLHFATRRPPD